MKTITDTNASRREKLQAELAQIKARAAKRAEQACADRDRSIEIDRELWALELAPLIGVPDGVTIRYRGWDRRIPDGTTGTLTKIARKRASVDFGEHGNWTLPITDLIAAAKTDERGLTLHLGRAS
jgi:hypothetical protein